MAMKSAVFNLTQHEATGPQLDDGLLARTPALAERIKELLTIPSSELLGPTADASLADRARQLAGIALDDFEEGCGAEFVMVGGHLELTALVVKYLRQAGLVPVYSVSDRVSRDVFMADGTVKKVSEFTHLGWKSWKA